MADHLDEVVAVAQECLRNVATSLADWLVKQESKRVSQA
jgi:hypothetical protein